MLTLTVDDRMERDRQLARSGRRPRRRCVVCDERRAVDPVTGWCDGCEEQERFGREMMETE